MVRRDKLRYAQILNNKVHWIFEDKMTLEELGKHKFNLNQMQLIDITNVANVQEGYEYDGTYFTNSNIIPFATLQENKLKSAGSEFVKRRDATTYVTQLDGVTVYGYDRQTEDVVNFMAARERAKLAESVPYKVYLSDGSKALIDHTLDMFDMCLNQSATEQLVAYAWYEGIKAQISACTTEAELDAITW